MRTTLTIAAKELKSYFTSPVAYGVMIFFFFVNGFIFVFYLGQRPEADMEGMLHTMLFLSLILSPVLTMGLLSSERASGTIELLMTRPVRDVEVVLGKFLAAVGMYAVIMLVSFEYPLIMSKFGQLDWAATLAGYLGLLLCACTFMAIGVFFSSLTESQIAAVLIGWLLLLFFWLVGFLAPSVSPALGDIVKYLWINGNFDDFGKGVLDTKSVIYFLSLSGFMLFLTVRSLEMRRTV